MESGLCISAESLDRRSYRVRLWLFPSNGSVVRGLQRTLTPLTNVSFFSGGGGLVFFTNEHFGCSAVVTWFSSFPIPTQLLQDLCLVNNYTLINYRQLCMYSRYSNTQLLPISVSLSTFTRNWYPIVQVILRISCCISNTVPLHPRVISVSVVQLLCVRPLVGVISAPPLSTNTTVGVISCHQCSAASYITVQRQSLEDYYRGSTLGSILIIIPSLFPPSTSVTLPVHWSFITTTCANAIGSYPRQIRSRQV